MCRWLIMLMLLPVSSVLAADVDLHAADLQKLKREYLQTSADAVRARHEDYAKLLQEGLAHAQTARDEKQASGNLTGVAVWKKAIEILEQCGQELKDKKDFEIPEKVRRELTSTMDDMRRQKKEIDQKYSVLIDPLRDRYFDLFVDKVKTLTSGQAVDEATLKQWFAELLASSDAVTAAPVSAPVFAPVSGAGVRKPAATPSGGGSEKKHAEEKQVEVPPVVEPPKPPPEPVVPEIVGASGKAADWITFARWHAEVSSVEVASIPVLNVSEVRKAAAAATGESSGAEFQTRYEPVRVLTSGEGVAFRIKSLPKRLAADVMEWPASGNNWTLVVRLKPGDKLPSMHGLELQASANAKTVGAAAAVAAWSPGEDEGDVAAKDAVQSIRIKVTTKPEGATVYVDGQIYQEGTASARTPCTVDVVSGKHQFKLVLPGFRDGVFRDFEVKPGTTLDWTFMVDRGADETTVKAFAQVGWRTSRIKVVKGDRLIITTHGMWNGGNEQPNVGADGYASSGSAYSGNPEAARRLVANANYGALLMKIGEKGAIRSIGSSGAKLTVDSDGELFFGINEAASALSDNSGSITIKVKKSSGGSAP